MQVQLDEMLVIGIPLRTSLESAEEEIGAHWGRFHSEGILNQIPNRVSDEIINLYCDYDGDYTDPYTLIIGAEVTTLDEVPEGMVGKKVPSQTYEHYSVTGPMPQAIVDQWTEVWNSELRRAYTFDFERHGSTGVELFIALRSGGEIGRH